MRKICKYFTNHRKMKNSVFGKKKKKVQNEIQRKNYEDIVRENKNFETYYKLQKICPEENWECFMNALKSNLPTSFRITSSRSDAKALLGIVQGQYFKDILNSRKENDVITEPVALPWYPDNLAWQIQLSRNDIRRYEAFSRLRNFLIAETNSGNLSRQEVVSMIPPIALDVKSHHKVLDMCASPGSKTAQIIEYLHKDDQRLPEGFVVANDIDNSRCYMLVHQAKRLGSPNIVITNHDAAIMPNFTFRNKDGSEEFLKFDRILCDVPCSGDGTLRKNSDIWTKWNAVNGNSLHGVQFRLIKRGVEMLSIGGRLVYSTCSLNPLENEAVISRLLTEANGSLKLVDFSQQLPGLKYIKGLKTWLVSSKDLNTYKSFEEVPEKLHTVIRPQMFPPSEAVVETLNLDKCMRILPHQQDTGAFFVAALEKIDKLPWESSQNNNTDGGNSDKAENKEPSRKKRKIYGYKEDPYIFFDENEPIWKDIKEFYDISDNLPAHCLLTRSKEGKKKNIYLTSTQVRDLVFHNAAKFKIINTGVKTFARCDNKGMKCPFRLAQEGLWSVFPFIGLKRKVSLTKEDFILLLSHDDGNSPSEIIKLNEETQKAVSSIGSGSCVLMYHENPESKTSLHFELVGWIGAVSVRLYVPLNDRIHFLRLLGGDTSKFDINRKAVDEAKQNNQDQTVCENDSKLKS